MPESRYRELARRLLALRRSRTLGLCIVALGSVFICRSLATAYSGAAALIRTISLSDLAAAIGAASLGMFLFSFVFWTLLARVGGAGAWQHIVRAYSLSAIARYLPGRIWGVYYQMNSLGNPREVVRANIHMALLSTAQTVLCATCAILYSWTSLFTASSVYVVGLLSLFILSAQFLFPDPAGRLSRRSLRVSLRTLLVLQLEWCTFVLVWRCLLESSFGWDRVLLVAANYSLAWIVGIVCVFFPAGLVAREGAFLAAGHWLHLPEAELLLWAAAARVVFTCAELLTAVLSLVIARGIAHGDSDVPGAL